MFAVSVAHGRTFTWLILAAVIFDVPCGHLAARVSCARSRDYSNNLELKLALCIFGDTYNGLEDLPSNIETVKRLGSDLATRAYFLNRGPALGISAA
jgi:hypothetical protein